MGPARRLILVSFVGKEFPQCGQEVFADGVKAGNGVRRFVGTIFGIEGEDIHATGVELLVERAT